MLEESSVKRVQPGGALMKAEMCRACFIYFFKNVFTLPSRSVTRGSGEFSEFSGAELLSAVILGVKDQKQEVCRRWAPYIGAK